MDLGAASAGTRQSKSLGCWERRCLLWNKWRRDSEVRNSSCWLSSRDVLGSRVHDSCYLVYSFMHSSLICKDNCKSCIRRLIFLGGWMCLLAYHQQVCSICVSFSSKAVVQFWHLLSSFINYTKNFELVTWAMNVMWPVSFRKTSLSQQWLVKDAFWIQVDVFMTSNGSG